MEWCKYLQLKEKGKQHEYKHKPIPVAIMNTIKPIFYDLTDKTLLRKCLDGLSQNPNESFNNLIWTICPKNKYHGVQTVETAVGLSVIMYNDGMSGLFSVFENLKLECGTSAQSVFLNMDKLRFRKAEKRATEASLEARRARRKARLGIADSEDGNAYSAGSW